MTNDEKETNDAVLQALQPTDPNLTESVLLRTNGTLRLYTVICTIKMAY